MTTTVADGRLMLRLDGQPPLPLRAVGSSFITEVANVELRFERAADGAAETLVVRQLGQKAWLQRVPS